MKIRQKLTLGFLGTSLLVGVVGYVSILANMQSKYHVSQLGKVTVKVVDNATEMAFALQAIQVEAQRVILEKQAKSSETKKSLEVAKESKEARENLEKEIERFEELLFNSRKVTESGIQIAKENGYKAEVSTREDELEAIGELEAKFAFHKKLTSQYLILVETNPDKAEEILEKTLKQNFRDKLLPLIREYEADAEQELDLESIEIEADVDEARTVILGSTTVALLIAILFGSIIARSIANPINKLQNAVIKVGKGKLDTKVDVKSKDEVGILANAFNQMVEDLNITTVSKSYVDNIIKSMVASLIVCNPDATIKRINQATLNLLGYAESELIGKSIRAIFSEHKVLEIDNLIAKGFIEHSETSYITKDGSKVPVSFSGSVMRSDSGEVQGIVCVAQDITERKQAEITLRESQQMLQLVMNNIPQSILWKDRNSVYLGCNRHFAQAAGIGSPEDIIGKTDYDLPWKREETEFFRECDRRVMETDTPEYHIIEPLLRADGQQVWLDTNKVPLHDLAGNVVGILGTFEDITERKQIEEQLRYDALHDKLTGLSNRTLFLDRLAHVIELTKRRQDYLFAVLFLDLDRFKMINDSLGHTSGDQLLIGIARRFKTCMRSGDTVARLGGDEFTVLLEDVKDIGEVTDIAERIQQSLSSPFNLNGHEMFTSASIGIVLSTTRCTQPEDLLRDADTAMYHAKLQGPARHEVFHPSMHDRAVAQMQLENDLRRAIKRQEFQVYYQPIVSLEKTSKINGFEALVRWQHPKRGVISPTEFIPRAEETGLIIPLGYWVLREACRQMRAWQVQFPVDPPLTISVNISGKQFSQPNLIEQIKQVLQETELDACSLKLEITESTIMENSESAADMLLAMRALGIELAVDDFGTGYSSLGHLNRFPVNTLKIDRSFVMSVDADVEKMEIIRTVVMLARNLGMNVVAEGVETSKELSQLKVLECEGGQGYFFSRPLNSEAAAALLAENSSREFTAHQ